MSQPIFKSFSKPLSINERIKIKVDRYNQNYFLNCELEELEEFDEHTRPLVKVTQYLYDKNITRDSRAKDKKLAYVFEHMDDYSCIEFKTKWNNCEFRNVLEAEKLSWQIFKNINPDYSSGRSTVTSINGERVALKKRTLAEFMTSKETLGGLKDIVSLDPHEAKRRLEETMGDESTRRAYERLDMEHGIIGTAKENLLVILASHIISSVENFY